MTLSLHQVSFKVPTQTILHNLSLEFEPGILYGILGPNGAGKSTLLKTIPHIWNPTSGEIYWNHTPLHTLSRKELSQMVSLVPQNPSLFFDIHVEQMVALGLYPLDLKGCKAQQLVEKALRNVDGWHLRHKMVSQLSGGERQRIYIARSLATQAPILLLDEPTSYLDLRHQLDIWNLLRQLTAQGKLIIAAIHDFASARRFCDEVVILHQGECKAKGTYSQVMTLPLIEEVFGVERFEWENHTN